MKKILLSCVFLLSLIFLIAQAKALTLPSAQTEFVVSNIVLSPVDDYTHTSKFIGLFGSKEYLNVFWDADYSPESTDPIGVICWLNCPYKGGDIESVCTGYQNCSYIGSTGKASCTIYNPRYNYTEKNIVICKFYDPNYPQVLYLPHPNRTFDIFLFSVSAGGGSVAFTVGGAKEWPIHVTSYSFLSSNYTVNLTTDSQYIQISNPNPYTERISYGETSEVDPKLTFTTIVDHKTIRIFVRPNEDPTTCTQASECSQITYGKNPACIEGVCWKEYDIPVSSGYASMPEYGMYGIIQLIVVATVVFAFTCWRSKI